MSTYKKAFIFVILFIILLIILTYVKINLLYHPTPAVPGKYQKFYQRLLQLTGSVEYVINTFVQTTDGILLDVIYIQNPDSDKCFIFFHGNAGNISMRLDMIKFLYNYCSVIIFDYRAYGKSTGATKDLCSNGLRTDAQTVWNFAVKKLGIPPNNLLLFGESLGCSIAIDLASNLSKTFNQNYYPHSLILNAPFYSMASMIQVIFDKIGIGFLGKIFGYVIGSEYQSNKWIQYVNHRTKIIIAHSPRDEIIPYQEGSRLFALIAKINSQARFINITGTHNNLGLTDHYIYALADLFNEP